MTTKTLEQEARELYKVIVSAMKPETPRYTEIGEQIAEFQFVQGYLAAATARDKEIEELQVELIDLRAVLAESKANYDKALYAIEAAVKIGGGHLEEIASLRARVKELEGMVPKWCGVQGLDRLRALGWSVAARNWQDKPPMWLMVPPIPLPEGK